MTDLAQFVSDYAALGSKFLSRECAEAFLEQEPGTPEVNTPEYEKEVQRVSNEVDYYMGR